MSKVVDQRVVEMQFDNSHFERNVATSMSTLDKLKQKLNIGGAAKSLENIDTAARKVNLNGLGSAVDGVSARFSALQVMGVTALANITNSAVNAGKRIVSALTIDPIKTGFQEYETQINSVQTILANTSSKGTTIDDVNKALDELNKYADMTIYNFTEMTRNIGTFTAAGVDLDTSVNAIKGIANLAAVSGSTSQQASTAMYQLSQALASGTVKLMDWNSVVNAGMGGEVFQNSLKETARLHGVAIDEMIEKEGSFRDTLSNGWLTSEILTETLGKFTLAAEKGTDQWNELKKTLTDKGYTDTQAEEILNMGNMATDAATKVKTFTQLWDVMKESAQSGWAQTWKLIVGDFEEAKAFLTPVADTFTSIINSMSEARNKVLESALGKGFTQLIDGFTQAKSGVEAMLEPINTAVSALEELSEIADKVIYGSFGNGVDRMNALSEAGYNFYRVQNKVNETLGNSFRYSEEQISAQDKLLESQSKSVDKTGEQIGATVEMTEANKEYLKTLITKNDEELKSAGYTEKQIEALRELEAQAEKIGIPIDEFIDKIDEINGRWILLNSFKNIGKGIVEVFDAMKAAWEGIFPPRSVEERAETLFNLIGAFHKLTSSFTGVIYQNGKLTDTGENLVKTFEGLFAAIDLIATVTNGAFKFAFEIGRSILSYFDLDILEVTAAIGEAIVGFRDFVDSLIDIEGAVSQVMPYFEKAAEGIKTWIEGFKTTDNIPKYIIEGLISGLTEGATAAWDAMVSFAKGLYDAFCDFFGIQSPSVLMISAGLFIVAGLVTGLTQGFGTVVEAGTQLATGLFNAIKDVILNIFEYLTNLDLGTVLTIAGLGAGLFMFKQIADAFSAFAKIFEGLGDVFDGLGEALEGLGKNLKAGALEKKSKAMLNMAIAMGILVAALFVLTKMCSSENIGALLGAVGLLIAIAGILAGLSFAMAKISSIGSFKVAALSASLLALGVTMLLLAATAKIMGGMEPEVFDQGASAVIAFGTVLMLLIATTQKVPTGGVKGLGGTILAIGVAMLALAGVAKIIAGMTWYEMGKAAAGIGAFTLIIVGLIAATRLAGGGKKIKTAGSMIAAVGAAMLLMAATAKIIAGMSWDEMKKAGVGIGAFTLIIVGLIAATRLAGNKIKSAGSMIAAVGAAMLMMAITAKIIAGMDWSEMGKAAAGLAGLGLIIAGLIAATRLAGPGELKRVGTTLLLMSVSIGILALVAALLGMMNVDNLKQGVVAVGLLSAMMTLMIAATKNAQDCKGNIIAMSVAIGIMALSVGLLSLIDPEKLKAPLAAMTILMAMFSVMLAASKLATGSMGTIIALTVVIGALAAVLWLLSDLPVYSVIPNAIALSALLLACSGAIAILSVIGKTAVTSLAGVLVLTAMAVPLLAFVGVLALMQNIQNAITNAAALTLLAGALTLMLIPLTLVGSLIGPALLGVLSLTAMAVPLLAFVGVLALMEGLENAESNIDSIIKLTVTMTAVLTALAIVGPLATVGIGALTALTAFIVGFGALATGIGALTDKFPELETFLDSGIGLLEEIAYGLGSVIGSFADGFSDKMMGILPKLGSSLSDFMTNATPFIEGASSINSKMLSGVKAIAETVLILTAVDVIEGLTSWLTGGSSLASFGAQLPQLGKDLSEFSESLGTFDEAKVATVTCAANAIKAIANVAKNLPNDGGLWGKMFGENSISAFGAQLPQLATDLSGFATNLGTFDQAKVDTITCAANAIKAVADVAKNLPNDGGLWGKIFGENSISSFGEQLPDFATNLSTFSDNLGTFDQAKVDTITCAGAAISAIASAAENLPNDGGLWGKIFGENSLASFGDQLPDLATCLSEFASELGTFSSGQVSAIKAAALAVEAVGDLGEVDLSSVNKNIGNFGDNMVEFAEDLNAFCDTLSGSTKISVASVNLTKFLDMVNQLADVDNGALSDLGRSLKTVGQEGIDDFVSAFTSQTAKTNVLMAASDLIKKAADAMGSGESKNMIREAIAGSLTSAVGAINDKYQDFYSAGAYLSEGLAAGIASAMQSAINAAVTMVIAAKNAAEKAMGIASPSKVFYRIGEFTGMGFVNALFDYGEKSYNAARDMADSARAGLKTTLGEIANVLEQDLDFQPTIRPVLDLSDVRSGVGTIGGLFDMRPSMGVLANVGAISTSMSRNGQNGTNADVVSAIDKLRGDISGLGTTQYNIDGITYDDGSNIAEAVKTIARRVKIERRV